MIRKNQLAISNSFYNRFVLVAISNSFYNRFVLVVDENPPSGGRIVSMTHHHLSLSIKRRNIFTIRIANNYLQKCY